MLGSDLQAFEITLDHLKVWVQFDQVIGSFQALQHRAAKMFTDLELSRGAVEAALAAVDTDSPQAAQLLALTQ
jgi:alkylation response protein AidB-like acyl-CoA dehydrogenase